MATGLINDRPLQRIAHNRHAQAARNNLARALQRQLQRRQKPRICQRIRRFNHRARVIGCGLRGIGQTVGTYSVQGKAGAVQTCKSLHNNRPCAARKGQHSARNQGHHIIIDTVRSNRHAN